MQGRAQFSLSVCVTPTRGRYLQSSAIKPGYHRDETLAQQYVLFQNRIATMNLLGVLSASPGSHQVFQLASGSGSR